MENLTFPQDFKEKKHEVIPNAKQWLAYNSKGEIIISIVGGGAGLYGNGKTTFEYWDYSEDAPEGYLSIEEINQRLKDR